MFLQKTRAQEKEMANKKTATVEKELSDKTFLFLLFLEIVVLGGLMFVFLISPFQEGVKKTQIDIDFELLESEKIEKQKQEIGEIEKMLQEFSGDKEVFLDTILSEEEKIPLLVVNLEEIVAKAGFEMIGIEFFGLEKKESLKKEIEGVEENLAKKADEFYIEIEVKGGGYYNFKKMIEKIESNMRLFEVERFSFATDRDVFKIKLKTFIYR